jgi:uncharacterized damage-inducible protein DinB
MNPQIQSVKMDFDRTTGRLLTDLAATPDDKLNWSPSPTARTPLEVAFHCAEVISGIHGSVDGTNPMPSVTPAEMDAYCREQEMKPRSREDVVKMIEEKSSAYSAWLEGLSDEKLLETWQSPFGPIPMTVAISLPTFHTANHVAQLEYIQTIYGDRIWH